MDYEILNDAGEVINIIVAEEDFVQQQYPGRYRLRVQPTFTGGESKSVSKLALLDRFTSFEYIAFLNAAKTDIEVQAWNEKLALVKFVDLEDPRTIAALTMLVNKGLLTEDRKNKILTDPIQQNEKP